MNRPIDSKREEFRKYLEKAGVMDALTKALVMLYEEPDKPEDALEYVRSNLGGKRPSATEISTLKTQLESYEARIQVLETENMGLKRQLGIEPEDSSTQKQLEDEASSETPAHSDADTQGTPATTTAE